MFNFYEDKAGLFRWRLVADNGRIIADSSEGYSSEQAAEKGAQTVIDLCKTL